MGKAKLQKELNVTKEKSDELFLTYHNKVPFVKQLMNKIMNASQAKGQIKTLLGRRCRFPKYEPILNGSDWGKYIPAEDEERMKELQDMGPVLKDFEGNIIKDKDGKPKKNYWYKNPTRRAFTYKALNKLIQGSAADMTKKAMVDLYKKGIVPHIQIHDELCVSIKDQETRTTVQETMEKAIELKINNKVDCESGPNWGTIK